MKLRKFRRSAQPGQGMVELALILVLVSLIVILTLMTLGNQVNATFIDVQEALMNPNDPGSSTPYTCPGAYLASLHGHKFHCQ